MTGRSNGPQRAGIGENKETQIRKAEERGERQRESSRQRDSGKGREDAHTLPGPVLRL